MAKIAKADRDAMNALFQKEMAKLNGGKRAADTGYESNDEQAFDDHKDYLDTLENVLKEDKSSSWEPNNPLLD